MEKIIFILSLLALSSYSIGDARVRRIAVTGDQIVTVHTSMGIATIIQVPDRPNSVVVGDQDAFKVEYLDQAITIKPLLEGAKSNLYVYTDWKRFNVQLISGREAIADYVVYLENPKEDVKVEKNSSIIWTHYKNSLRNENLIIETNRLGKAKNGVLLIEFLIKGAFKEKIKPEYLWITQNGITRPIQNLFLSALEVLPSIPVSGVIQLQQDDLDLKNVIRLEFKAKKTSFLTIQKVNSWK
jgi:hypothetical protein